MNMIMSLVAILISLAMMLTGAGGEGQPVEASRVLTLHDVSVTVNGERVDLEPAVRLGVSTDGQKALYEFGVEAGGETLLPIQLSADKDGVSALFEGSGEVVNVSAAALEALMQGVSDGTTAQVGDSELMQYLTDVYIPAYAALIEAVQDEDFLKQMQTEGEAIVYGIIDRGEGVPVTKEIDGAEVALTQYTYSMDSAQAAAVADAVLTGNDTLHAYYDALFGLYEKLPEETGLRGITSYADMFEKTGLTMNMDIDEKRSDDGTIVLTDAVLTMDMSGMMANMAQAQGDGVKMPEMEPVVANIHSSSVNGDMLVDMDMSFKTNEAGMEMSMRMAQGDDSSMMDLSMHLSEDGGDIGSIHVNCAQTHAGPSGSSQTHANVDIDVDDQGRFELSFMGRTAPDGTSEGDVGLGFENGDMSFELSFSAGITSEALEDRVSGREATLVIDDLSEEGLSAVLGEENAAQVLMKIGGSMTADVQKLLADEGIQKLAAMFTAPVAEEEAEVPEDAGETEAPIEPEEALDESEDEDGDYSIEIESIEADDGFEIDLSDLDFEDGDFDIELDDDEYADIEDDGELGFEVPELTWLPEGWHADATNQDTAYDWADVSIKDEDGKDCLYAVFFADAEAGDTCNYIVDGQGGVAPVEGREITVVDFGEGSVSVTLRESGLYINLLFSDAAVDLETIGRIVASIQF